MRNAFILATCLLALPLSACTGSFEDPDPVLLVTGFQRVSGTTATNHVGLISDNLNLDSDTLAARFDFLTDSVRNLPAPAVSYDITNRENARNTLIVLSRGLNEDDNPATPPYSSFLSFFSINQIKVDNPVDFKRPPGRTTDTNINDIDAVPEDFPNRTAPFYCPSEVQVTRGGNYAAVLNVPRLCGVNAAQFIDVLALDGTPRLLGRINNVASGENPGAAGGIYVSQGSAEDILYYAVRSPSSLTLNALTLPRPGQQFGPDDRLPTAQVVASVRNRAEDGAFVDLGVSGQSGSDQLAVLSTRGLAYVSSYSSDGEATEPVGTLENDNARLIRDDLRQTDATLVLALPEANRFSYFPASFTTDEDGDLVSDEVRGSVAAVDAVIESNNGYVYFVANGLVSLFDLQSYDTGDDLETQALTVSELTNPTFVTWAQALPTTAP